MYESNPPPEAQAFYSQTWDLSYTHALGHTTGRFLAGLKEAKIFGRSCPACARVLVPPRAFCDRCHTETTDWREVGPLGTIEMFTIVCEPFKGLPAPPYALAYVTLDGASTALVGYVNQLDLTKLEEAVSALSIGSSVTARFADEPVGNALDYWFETIPAPPATA